MGALLEEPLNPVAPEPQRQAVKRRPPSCSTAEGSCNQAAKKMRIGEVSDKNNEEDAHEAACLLSSTLRPALGCLRRKQKVQKGPLRAVLFDFDATLTSLYELQAERLFPKRGGSVDVTWLREVGFGGESRILRLGKTLQALAASGAELHIVSLCDRGVIVRALAILGALHFFCDRIVGWEELNNYISKAPFIKSLMDSKQWHRDEVLFVDDQERNLEDVRGLCLTHRTWGRGLCVEELNELRKRAFQM